MADDHEQLRAHLRGLSTRDLLRQYDEGLEAFRSREAWRLLIDEMTRRRIEDSQQLQNASAKARREQLVETCEATIRQRVVGAAADIGLVWVVTSLALLMGFPPMVYLWLIYHPLCELVFGRTVGKAWLGLRVVTEDGSRVSLKSILKRTLTRPFALVPVWRSVYNTPWIHDVVSKTRVVDTEYLVHASRWEDGEGWLDPPEPS